MIGCLIMAIVFLFLFFLVALWCNINLARNTDKKYKQLQRELDKANIKNKYPEYIETGSV